MKIVYCTCNVSVLETLQELMNSLEIKSYQIIDRVLAKNMLGDNRFDTAVWPSYNSSLIMQIADDQKAAQVMNAIRQLNKKAFNQNELVIAAMWTVDDFCFD